MKILFIGHYRDNCEEGELSRGYLRACAMMGHEVVARPIFLSPNKYPVEPDIVELENRQFDAAPDVVIQNVRPHFMQKTPYVNVGIIFEDITYNRPVIDSLNLMDKVLVQNDSRFLSSLLNISSEDVGYVVKPANTNVEPLNIEDTNTTYNFYFIDEYTNRTNLLQLIVAFNREFSIKDNVRLLIYSWTQDLANSSKAIIDDIKNTKQQMRLYSKNHYIEEIIITPQPFYQGLDQLHQTGDCLVVPTNRSCYNPHIAKALDFDNFVICTDNIGIANTNGINKVRSYPTISLDNRDLSSAFDICYNPCLIDLQRLMRQEYNFGKQKDLYRIPKPKNQFSIETVSNRINNAINKLYSK